MRKIVPVLLLAAAFVAAPAFAGDRENQTVDTSITVLKEMQAMPDMRIPDWLLARAEGIAILPEVVKGGVFIGGSGGSGVLLVRHKDGSWSNPVFIGIAGASFGPQFGIQTADVILVFTTRKSIEGITGGKITLGADASAAAGPVGRAASASTSAMLDAEIYSYSRAKGLFAGVSLAGSVLFIRDKADQRFYQKKDVLASDILSEQAPRAPEPAPALIEEVTRLATAKPVEAPATGDTPPASPAATEAPQAAPAQDKAKTFPMADPNPGSEPH